MKTYEIAYSHEGQIRRAVIVATDSKAAKRILCKRLGVKRLIGTNTEEVFA